MIKWLFIFWYAVCVLPQEIQSQNASPNLGNKAYELLNLPNLSGENLSGQVVIAVIDDGFLLSHTSTKDFYLINKNEIPGNGKDDDGNGYIDDAIGWDAADLDADVTPSENVLEEYYHGTAVSSMISKIARLSLGDKASEHIKIMPVKALSDQALNTSMHKGYVGLEYAIQNNADIICLAWSGGDPDDIYEPLFQLAVQKGILVLSTAGNFNTDLIQPPASISGVQCIAAVDSTLKKTAISNYGIEVDMAAPGDKVKAAHTSDRDGYISAYGTSAAVALVTGCAALLKLIDADAYPFEIVSALKSTATPLERFNPPYNGRLGAGMPNATAALEFLTNESLRNHYFLKERPEGQIYISRYDRKRIWEFESSTATKEYQFTLNSSRKKTGKGILHFYGKNGAPSSYKISDVPAEVVVEGNYTKLEFDGKPPKNPAIFSFESITIDSTTLYCDDAELNESIGEITDGSGPENYAHRVSCKWIINTPPGKNVKLDFQWIDTELSTDYVYIFRGTETIQDNMLAKFSGTKRPPLIIAGGNQMMLWFVTNDKINGQGWQLRYTATDETPGVFER